MFLDTLFRSFKNSKRSFGNQSVAPHANNDGHVQRRRFHTWQVNWTLPCVIDHMLNQCDLSFCGTWRLFKNISNKSNVEQLRSVRHYGLDFCFAVLQNRDWISKRCLRRFPSSSRTRISSTRCSVKSKNKCPNRKNLISLTWPQGACRFVAVSGHFLSLTQSCFYRC